MIFRRRTGPLLLALSRLKRMGRASRLCTGTSDVDLLSDGKRVVDLDAKIPNGALDLVVALRILLSY